PLLDESRGLSAVEIEHVEGVLLVVIAEPDGNVPAVGDVERHVAEDREALLAVELAAIVRVTGALEADHGREQRHPGVERVARPRPAVDAVRVERRIDRRKLPVAAQDRRIEGRIRAAYVEA